MAEIYAVVKETKKISSMTRTIHLQDALSYDEKQAHYFGVTLLNDEGNAADLTGCQVTGKFRRADNATVELNGTVSGNTASLVLAQSCYLAEGRFTLEIYLVKPGTNSTKRNIMRVRGMIEKNSSEPIIDPGEVVPGVDDVVAMMEEMEAATADAEEAADEARSAGLAVYCWGDSLTEGVGGYVMHPDGRNAYMAYSYPEWLSQTYNVVNFGARSENIPAIMARQGADPIVLQNAVNIPASADTPVFVGQVSQIYSQTSGLGLTSRSGALVKIHKEVESPGFNPCVIGGVEGNLYRELTAEHMDNDKTYNYYFRRLTDGVAVTAAAGTEIKTYAMLHCRKGVAVIWMGANGGYSSAADFVAKVEAMVEYGKYANYLVIISREFTGDDLETVKAGLTDEDGFCHVISLMDVLPYRGYAMAGIARQAIDTSGWATTDPIKKNAPLLCEYLGAQNPPNVYLADGGDGLNVYVNGNNLSEEDRYGALHYSAWGYKAIGKLIQEKLGTMRLVPTKQMDEYGTLLYKLPSARTLTGYDYIDTKVKLFDDLTKDWTFAIRWSGTPISPEIGNYPANIFCCAKDGTWKGLLYRYYQADGANILFGSGVFNINGEHNIIDNYGETNVVVIVKDGDSYMAFVNSEDMAYDEPLVYELDPEDATNLSLIIGARYNRSGSSVQYKTAFTVEDVRVYDSALSEENAVALYNELAE